ncbi:Mycobacterium rhizamassiliense ORFan [Mycobacterium rhizamassiliense]|jgi:hypothetical protein|uniref:Mycobacterium rhizamassiliense ORFan n=1 Tax=Mycobacterium rhizamassiliense TaxID=1841860 RepID=A0A2U3NZ64_9MYCO|nr:Mycobacterium rhizamassiliense ORFan [Mycobacterium rhizamassiliense]
MSVVTTQPKVLAPKHFGGQARAAGVREMFVNTPSMSSGPYALTEAAYVAATG